MSEGDHKRSRKERPGTTTAAEPAAIHANAANKPGAAKMSFPATEAPSEDLTVPTIHPKADKALSRPVEQGEDGKIGARNIGNEEDDTVYPGAEHVPGFDNTARGNGDEGTLVVGDSARSGGLYSAVAQAELVPPSARASVVAVDYSAIEEENQRLAQENEQLKQGVRVPPLSEMCKHRRARFVLVALILLLVVGIVAGIILGSSSDGSKAPTSPSSTPDSTTRPPSLQPEVGLCQPVSSEFNFDSEGWTTSGDAKDSYFSETGGNPGGHFVVEDAALEESWFYEAPPKFHGDFEVSYGYSLKFDLRQSPISNQFVSKRDVIITKKGSGLLIYYDITTSPALQWSSYVIPLNTSSWFLDDDTVASEGDIRSVLRDIGSILIRGEYEDGFDVGGIDNVLLECPNDGSSTGDPPVSATPSPTQDSTVAPPITSPSLQPTQLLCEPVSSTFDFDNDGWTTAGDARDSAFSSTGGNPGGHFVAEDAGLGESWFFEAPAKFHGDFGAFYGHSLQFDLRQSPASNQLVTARDVIITQQGGGLLIYYDISPNPGVAWSSYVIPLNASSTGWFLNDDSLASEADIRSVLSDIGSILIRGEYENGFDVGGIDNVLFECSNDDGSSSGGSPISTTPSPTVAPPTASPSLQPADASCQPVSSEFDFDSEGWTTSGDASKFNFSATGGNPGGHFVAQDDGLGESWFFETPAKFHGNFGGSYGYSLQFDLKQSPRSNQLVTIRDVIVTQQGGGLLMYYDLTKNPGLNWSSYVLPLNASSTGWFLNDDSLASEADIRTVLSDIGSILIRGEYESGFDVGGIDNVLLECSSTGI